MLHLQLYPATVKCPIAYPNRSLRCEGKGTDYRILGQPIDTVVCFTPPYKMTSEFSFLKIERNSWKKPGQTFSEHQQLYEHKYAAL